MTYGVSGDAGRILAVLVVATPCPLILATPVALIAGINRAARHGIVVKNGAAIETLAQVTVAVFDKTGTLTHGHPTVERVVAMGHVGNGEGRRELLALAGAVEQRSAHLLARAIVAEAEHEEIEIADARSFVEEPGRGARATVGDREVLVGSYVYVCAGDSGGSGGWDAPDAGGDARDACGALVREATGRAELVTAVGVDGACGGLIFLGDTVRPGLPALMARLRGLGVGRTVMLTGDNRQTALAVEARAKIGDVRAELRPADKTAAIAALRREEGGVLMVGDGINDAPALASASVGVAMGARGAAISAAAAAIEIGQGTMRIVWQCIGVGLGLSFVAMGAAALGLIHPIVGAAIQEAIDLAVVLNALRAR